MRRIAKAEVKKITPAKAQKILTQFAHFGGQRTLRPKLISHYANEIRADTFFNPTLMLARQAFNGGKQRLLNGHHTLNAIIVANKPITVTLEQWEVNSPDEQAALYGKFDTKGNRTQTEVVKAVAAANEWDLPSYIANAAVSAACFKEGKESLYKDEKAMMLVDYIDAAFFFKAILEDTLPDGAPKSLARHLRRKPVYYAILTTWEVCQHDARVFWQKVRDGEGLTRNMPEFLLREFLKAHAYSTGRGANRVRATTSHEMASRCITAWNASRRGKKLKIIKYYPSGPIPKSV